MHNKAVHATKKELKHNICFEWLTPLLVLIGIALMLLMPRSLVSFISAVNVFFIFVFSSIVAYKVISKKYCKPYYQNKEDEALNYMKQVTESEFGLSELINKDVTLFNKVFLWDEYVNIGDGGMHQDDYYSELYGGRWTKYTIEIDGKRYPFNPYKDIVYTD